MQCKAITKKGYRCRNFTPKTKEYCSIHKGNISSSTIILGTFGGLLGNLLAPGVGGFLCGAVTGIFAKNVCQEYITMKKKVFVSFDYDNDKILKDFIVGQANLTDSPFEISDWSMKEAAPEKSWEEKAETRIKRSDIVIVMVGSHTYKAPGVLKEVQMARNNNKPIVQIIGHKDGNYSPVPGAGRLYSWNWDNLKKVIG